MENFDDEVTKHLPDLKIHKVESKKNELKATFTFKEMWESKDEVQEFLIPELIPAHTVAVLIGEDGIGKTQITTQLCLHISMNHTKFLGLELNAKNKRCLICATEESRIKFTHAMVKQALNLSGKIDPDKIHIKFTEGSLYDSWEELKAEIERNLEEDPHDLVVIDALSDLFTLIDGEINSNSDARKILSACQALATTHKVTILIIHHAAKTKLVAKKKEGKLFVEKSDSQGAGAITQKPRTILALTSDPGTISADGRSFTNYLHVVKANLMSKTYMTNAIQCLFDTNSLLHSYTGMKDIEMHENPSDENNFERQKAKPQKSNELTDEDHKVKILDAFQQEKSLSRKELVSRLKDSYDCGGNKIEAKDGFLNKLISLGYISNDAGTFTLKVADSRMPTNDIELPDPDDVAPF